MRAKQKRASKNGNIVLVLACIGVILLAIVFFSLNVAGIFGTNKEAQTAIDAAALYAAREIANDQSLIIKSKLGYIGLVDMSPKDKRNPYFMKNGTVINPSNEAPVIGINTAIATARLDYQIAHDLNNKDMKRLVERDMTELRRVAKEMKEKMNSLVSKGSKSTLREQTMAVYEQNNRRMGGPGELDPNTFKIEIGHLKARTGSTNVSIPTPPDKESEKVSSSGLYLPYADVPVEGEKENFRFAAIASEARLVSNERFVESDEKEWLPTTVVRVKADNTIKSLAPNAKDAKALGSVHHEAAAQTGGAILNARSTVYTIGFAGAFPSENSMGKVLTTEKLLNFNGWQNMDPAHQSSTWLQNKGPANYPDNGGTLVPADFYTLSSAQTARDNPSTALASGLYDWLRSLRLRPNRQSVVAAIKTGDFRTIVKAREFKDEAVSDESGSDDSNQPNPEDKTESQESAGDVEEADFVPAPGPLVGCMRRALEPGKVDPRFLYLTDPSSEEGKRIYKQAFDYLGLDDPSGVQCSQSVGSILEDPITGEARTTSGASIVELCQLIEGMIATNQAAMEARLGGRMAFFESLQPLLILEGKAKVSNFLENELYTHRGRDTILKAHLTDTVQQGISRAEAAYNQLLADEAAPNPPAIPGDLQALATELNKLKEVWLKYKGQKLLEHSPLQSDSKYGIHAGETPASFLEKFKNISITAGNAASEASKLPMHRLLMNEEIGRVEHISSRALNCMRAGKIAMVKSRRFFRLCRQLTSSVKKLNTEAPPASRDYEKSPDPEKYPNAPVFALNVEGWNGDTVHDPTPYWKKGKFDEFLTSYARIAFVMPNCGHPKNKRAKIRTHQRYSGSNFYDLDPVTESDVNDFAFLVEQVQSAGFANAEDPALGKFGYFVKETDRLLYGSEHLPLQCSVMPAELIKSNYNGTLNGAKFSDYSSLHANSKFRQGLFESTIGNPISDVDKARLYRYEWCSRDPQRGLPYGVKYSARFYPLRPYSSRLVSGTNDGGIYKLKGDINHIDRVSKDPNSYSFPKLGELKQEIIDYRAKSNLETRNTSSASGGGTKNATSASPTLEMVFVLSCDGDVSKPNGGSGTIGITHIRHPHLDKTPRYPFGHYNLLPSQFLYFAGDIFQEGQAGLDPNHPAYVIRSVIARDQFADLENGKSYSLQDPRKWTSNFDIKIGDQKKDPPYPAGEFRIGNPFGVACCKLDLDHMLLKAHKASDLLPFQFSALPGDDASREQAELNAEEKETYDTCPPVYRTPSDLNYMNGPVDIAAPYTP
ncbi:MAG: hypothetical protein K2X27_09620 [Candidatus Obscuribacterales bacterium]|nr:hypothetical protein [Candidatus Obscuribacterales bacterium]